MENEKDLTETITEYLAVTPIAILLLVALMLLRGWAFTVLWNWFVMPLGMAEITVAHGLGISTLVSLFTGGSRGDKYASTGDGCLTTTILFLWPFIAVGVGWLVMQSM